MMNYLLTAALIICTICGQSYSFQAQNQHIKKEDEPPIKIESPHKIWGNYLIDNENIIYLEKKGINKEQIQEIVAFSHQSTWSLALQHVFESPDFPNNFPQYNSTFVTIINEEPELYLYKIAFAENSHLPDSFLLDHQDFYMVVKK